MILDVTQPGTLTPNTVYRYSNTTRFQFIQILNYGDVDLWARVDGSDPIIGGVGSIIVPAGSWITTSNPVSSTTAVCLVSSGTTNYVIELGNS
jgi:hypothetical protein